MSILFTIAAATALRGESSLHLAPGFRTFPEIAALVGETPSEVRCDPQIAHRMVFASARSISREGLLSALGLVVVPDGKRRLMKDADAKLEREWASTVRDSLARRSVRTIGAALAAAEAGTPSPGSNWYAAPNRILTDPKATPAERKRADQSWLDAYGAFRTGDEEFKESIGAERALAAFPAEVSGELLERGLAFDAMPLAALPSGTVATLRRVYPDLKGGPDAIVLRRVTSLQGAFALSVQFAMVDPGQIVPFSWGFAVVAIPDSPEPSMTGDFLRADAERVLPLRLYRTTIAAIRATEAPGRALVDAYAAEVPPLSIPGATSLSQAVEAWAAKGHDVIQELDPLSEDLLSCFVGTRLRPNGDWSPQSVEGILVLRPLLRFVNARRRFPIAALMALEATGDRPKLYGYSLVPEPSPAGRRLYA